MSHQCRLYERLKQGMGREGARGKLRMKLGGNKKWMVFKLNDFHKIHRGTIATKIKPRFYKLWQKVIVYFIAMPMCFQ